MAVAVGKEKKKKKRKTFVGIYMRDTGPLDMSLGNRTAFSGRFVACSIKIMPYGPHTKECDVACP